MNFNILGIGLPQIAIVLVLSLVLFGPKQMMAYAYQAGRFLAKARAMWEEAARNMQAEIQNSGLDLKEFQELGQGLRQDMNKAVGEVNSSINTTLSIPAWDPGIPYTSGVVTPSVEPTIVPPAPAIAPSIEAVSASPVEPISAVPAPSLNLSETDSTEVSADSSKKYDAWLLN